jgi:hypothetical protein
LIDFRYLRQHVRLFSISRLLVSHKEHKPNLNGVPTDSSSTFLTPEEKKISDKFKNLLVEKEVSPSELARITKSLSDICDVKMLEKETPEKIIELWKQFHMKKYCVFASMPSSTYTSLSVRLQQNPMFILPRTSLTFTLLSFIHDFLNQNYSFIQFNSIQFTCFFPSCCGWCSQFQKNNE